MNQEQLNQGNAPKNPGFFRRRYEGAKQVVRTGLAFDLLKDVTRMFWNIAASIFNKKIIQPETFEQASQRLDLSEADIQARIKSLKNEILIFSFSAITIFSYAVYLGISGAGFFAVLIALLVSTSLFICAFKSHFWLFQVRNRKLGCTFQEWINSTIKGSH